MFEGPEGMAFLRALNPYLTDLTPLGHTSLRQELTAMYKVRKQVVKKELDQATTAIHISFDLWTSPNQMAIIALFGHFLDEQYRYQSRLLAFRRHLGSHSGERIALTLYEAIQSWGIGQQLGVAVCDNASNNDVCLQHLFPYFINRIPVNSIRQRRIRCFGHILNLVAKAFLFGLDAEADDFTAEADHLEQQQQSQQQS